MKDTTTHHVAMWAVFGLLAGVVACTGCAPSNWAVGTGFEGIGESPGHPTEAERYAVDGIHDPSWVENLYIGGRHVRVYYDTAQYVSAICAALDDGLSGDAFIERMDEYATGKRRMFTEVLGCAALAKDGPIHQPDGSSWDCVAFAVNRRIADHELGHCVGNDDGHGDAFDRGMKLVEHYRSTTEEDI